MKLRYLIKEINRNGTENVRYEDIDKAEITIGRGSGCDIHFDSHFVSLSHAKIITTDGKLVVEDAGSLSGIFINGSLVKRHILENGDSLKIGNINLEICIEDNLWIIIEKREETDGSNTETLVARDLNRVDIAKRLPSMKLLSALFFMLVLCAYFVFPIATSDYSNWSSGPISSNHAMIANNCKACHASAFTKVADKECLSCHNMESHALNLGEEHAVNKVACTKCHIEHKNTSAIALKESQLCVSCHFDIKKVNADAATDSVKSFESHPEFSVKVFPAIPNGTFSKVKLNDTANLKDNSNVKLNHQIHLKPLRSKSGEVQLGCRDCHMPSDDKKSMKSISFEKHCRDCHSLEFDDRLPGLEVTHGDPDVVYKSLYAEYAKFILASEKYSEETQTVLQRFKPGTAIQGVATSQEFKKTFVEKESRAAERLLFTKTACYLCHRISESDKNEDIISARALSRFQVLKPQIQDIWMNAARFSHAAHEEIKCESCHSGVRDSTKTTQVLMPKLETCRECHSQEVQKNKIQSDCVMCHSFHDQKLISDEKKRAIDQIIQYMH
jgi:predicted CXXCH cytochrome family protein